jgi:hypothetical protein
VRDQLPIGVGHNLDLLDLAKHVENDRQKDRTLRGVGRAMQPHVEIMSSGGRNHAIDVGKNKRGQQNDDATANASDPAPRCRCCLRWNLIGHKQNVVLMNLGMRIAADAA